MHLRLFKHLKKTINKHHVLIIALVLQAIPLFWYGSSRLLAGGETFTILSPKNIFYNNLFTWHSLGLPNLNFSALFYTTINLVLSSFLDTSLIQRIIMGSFLSLSFLSCYSLLKYCFRSSDTSKWALILSSLFYIFNPYFIQVFTWVPTYGIFFIVSPLILLHAFRTVDSGSLANFIVYSIACVLLSTLVLNLALLGLIFIIIFIYLIIKSISDKDIKGFVVKGIMIITGAIFPNLFWILPLKLLSKSLFKNVVIYASNFEDVSIFKYPMLKSFCLNEYYWFDKSNTLGELFYPYSFWYQPISILIIIILLIIIIYYLFYRRYKFDNLFATLFLLLFLFGIFFTKGSAPPLGLIYRLSLTNLPFFGMYRSSDIKFPYFVVLGLVFLLSLVLAANKKKYLYVTTIISIFLLSIPLIFGLVIPRDAKKLALISIPNYWYETANFLEYYNKEGKVLILPKNVSSFDNYDWGFEGGWLLGLLGNIKVIGNTNGYGATHQEIQSNDIYYRLQEGETQEAISEMKLYNIKYLLIRNDFDLQANSNNAATFEKDYTYQESERLAHNVRINFEFVKKYGELEIYSVPEESFVEKIYLPEQLYVVDNDIKTSVLNKAGVGGAFSYVDNNDMQKLVNLKANQPSEAKVSYSEINPTKYKVLINEASKPLFINFSETYDDNWKLISPNQWYSTKSVNAGELHIVANGYANGWVVDPQKICKNEKNICSRNEDGSYNLHLLVEFFPQRFVYIGAILSSVYLFLCVIYLSTTRRKDLLHKIK